jgi:TRAP-type uncharacterized transport system fused permease subunit
MAIGGLLCALHADQVRYAKDSALFCIFVGGFIASFPFLYFVAFRKIPTFKNFMTAVMKKIIAAIKKFDEVFNKVSIKYFLAVIIIAMFSISSELQYLRYALYSIEKELGYIDSSLDGIEASLDR